MLSFLSGRPPAEVPVSLVRVVQILQLMYHMALDAFDKASPPTFSPPDVGLTGKDVSHSVWTLVDTERFLFIFNV